MKKIKLTQGKFALVDDVDYKWLNQWKWCAMYSYGNWYAMRGKRPQIFMHRLILNTPFGMDTDHINHNTLDNKHCNIRVCTHQQNSFNGKPRKGTSKYKGVSWFKRDKKWRAYIVLNNKQIHLGYFISEIEAARTYDKAAIKHFGVYAFLNHPEVELKLKI